MIIIINHISKKIPVNKLDPDETLVDFYMLSGFNNNKKEKTMLCKDYLNNDYIYCVTCVVLRVFTIDIADNRTKNLLSRSVSV